MVTAAHTSSSVLALVDLPELLQTISTQRRTGTLTVRSGDQQRRGHFANGQVRALCGAPAKRWADSLVWSEVLKPDQIGKLLAAMTPRWKESELTDLAIKQSLMTKDGALDALDCY